MTLPVQVQTGCRLHFGPLAVGAERGRSFGGVGLMVDQPGFELLAAPAATDQISAADDFREVVARSLSTVREHACGLVSEGLELGLRRTVPRHFGLGSGTQLALAVAQAAAGGTVIPATQLARWTGRGARSAIGIYGYEYGGFLVDAGKSAADELGALAARVAFPAEWRVLLWRPSGSGGLSGAAERDAFGRMPPMSAAVTDRLCGIVLREMLPSLAAREWQSFSQGLRRYGDLVGAHFAPAQGGVWAHPRGAEVVNWWAQQGVHGAAQSSWGPTIAAIAPDEAAAEVIRQRWPFAAGELSVTRPRNRGADVTPSIHASVPSSSSPG